ncbi:MAG: hypothetical protein QOJ66_2450 [Ilumatobacteraceae bacterium]
MANVVRQGSRRQTRRLALEIGVVAVLVAAGVAVFTHSNRTSRNVDIPPLPTTQTTVSSVPTSVASAAEISQWFVDYTGNPVGPASGDPVKFGVVMQPFAYRFALDAAATYLNDHAGGVGGRPIDLDVCQQTLLECADRYAADPAVVAVLENQWDGSKNVGNHFTDSMAGLLAGLKPVHNTYSNSGTSGVAYYPTYLETVVAMALEAKKLTVPGARVLVIDGATNTPDVTSILEGRDVVAVDASSSETLTDAIRRVGATDVAAIVLAAPVFVSGQVHAPNGGLLCDNFTNAIAELGMRAAVIVAACDPHEGWYKVDVGLNETSPTLESGALSIGTQIHTLGATDVGPPTRDLREIGALLAVIRMINELGGPAKATPEALDQAMRNFTGPLPLGAGPLDCSPSGKVAERVAPGSCVRFVDVHQFVHEKWIDLPPIDLGS